MTETPSNRRGRPRSLTIEDLGRFTDEVILLGVARIVDDKLAASEKKVVELISDLGAEMRRGFSEMNTSLKFLAGEVGAKIEDHGKRITRLEEKVGSQEKSK